MTVEELYDSIGANYKEAIGRLVSEKFIAKYIVKFVDDTSYSELMNAWQSNDSQETIFRAAHTLKGVCLNLALEDLFETINVITEHFRPTGTQRVDNIEPYFDELEMKYNNMIEKIREYAEND